MLTDGLPLDVEGPVRVRRRGGTAGGRPLDYCELDAVGAPVVHVRVASVLAELAPGDVQLLPLEVEGQPDQFALVNVIRVVKCIDDQRSREVRYYGPDCEPVFRDRVGQYRSVIGMRVDPAKVGDARLFRPWGWQVAIVVAEEIKLALEELGTVGVKFQEV